MHKRRPVIVFIAMPVAVFIWCVGWGLYWVGKGKERHGPNPAKRTENVGVVVMLPEVQIEK